MTYVHLYYKDLTVNEVREIIAVYCESFGTNKYTAWIKCKSFNAEEGGTYSNQCTFLSVNVCPVDTRPTTTR